MPVDDAEYLARVLERIGDRTHRPEPTMRDLAEWEAAMTRPGSVTVLHEDGTRTPLEGVRRISVGFDLSRSDDVVRTEIEADTTLWDEVMDHWVRAREVQAEMSVTAQLTSAAFDQFTRQFTRQFLGEDSLREELGYLPGGYLPEPRLVRSPLGAPEDPNGWTAPVGDQMHWTAPETDEEVPRWLA